MVMYCFKRFTGLRHLWIDTNYLWKKKSVDNRYMLLLYKVKPSQFVLDQHTSLF